MNVTSTKIAILAAIGTSLWLSTARAVEPPSKPIRTSLIRAKSAFIGRVIEAREVERRPFQTEAVARILIGDCYCGEDCKKGGDINVAFRSQTTRDREFPVQFPVSSDVILIFDSQKKLSGLIAFDSDLEGGVDQAYVVDSYPEQFPVEFQRLVSDIYWPKKTERADFSRPLQCGAQSSGK
jgi:hypothetical protein